MSRTPQTTETGRTLLCGESVYLRGVIEADREAFHAWRNDPELKRQTGPGPFLPIARNAAMTDDPNTVQFAVCRRDTAALIGWIALSSISWSNRCAALGVYIGDPSARGSGLGSAAIDELLRYGFDELNLQRIELEVVGYNTPAIAVYERLGFVLEGRKREFAERDGERYDLLVYGLLAAEWRSRLGRR
jgi:RimJ/RimL family protein N-acetyltransferase